MMTSFKSKRNLTGPAVFMSQRQGAHTLFGLCSFARTAPDRQVTNARHVTAILIEKSQDHAGLGAGVGAKLVDDGVAFAARQIGRTEMEREHVFALADELKSLRDSNIGFGEKHLLRCAASLGYRRAVLRAA